MNRRAFLHTTVFPSLYSESRAKPVRCEQPVENATVFQSQNKKLFIETLYFDSGNSVSVRSNITWQDFTDTVLTKILTDTYILEGESM